MYAANFATFFARMPVKVKNVRKWTRLAEILLLANEMPHVCRGPRELNVYAFRS
jgi:hypothetical protein